MNQSKWDRLLQERQRPPPPRKKVKCDLTGIELKYVTLADGSSYWIPVYESDYEKFRFDPVLWRHQVLEAKLKGIAER